jgi:hypothetical protein
MFSLQTERNATTTTQTEHDATATKQTEYNATATTRTEYNIIPWASGNISVFYLYAILAWSLPLPPPRLHPYRPPFVKCRMSRLFCDNCHLQSIAAPRYTGRNLINQFSSERKRKMKKDTLLGLLVVAAAALLLLAVFVVVDGIPAVNAIASLVDVMR